MKPSSLHAGWVAAALGGAAALAVAQVQTPPDAAQVQTPTDTPATSPAPATEAAPLPPTGTSATNPPTVAPDNPALEKLRMSKIVGAQVKDREGNKIGDIEDVIVDEKGNASLAIVSSGGILGAGQSLRAVPWSELQPGPEGSDRVLDMTEEQLEKVPSFESDQWPTLNQQWLDDNRSYYEGR